MSKTKDSVIDAQNNGGLLHNEVRVPNTEIPAFKQAIINHCMPEGSEDNDPDLALRPLDAESSVASLPSTLNLTADALMWAGREWEGLAKKALHAGDEENPPILDVEKLVFTAKYLLSEKNLESETPENPVHHVQLVTDESGKKYELVMCLKELPA